MAVAMGYGDSRTYYRTKSEVSDMQQAVISYSQKNQAYSAANVCLDTLYVLQDNSAKMVNITPSNKPGAQRVIVDRGFGGGDCRPRSRRYADPE